MRLFVNTLQEDGGDKPIDVWIIAGSSNALGRGGDDPLPPFDTPNARSFIIGATGGQVHFSFTSIKYIDGFNTGDNHGIEPSLVRNYNSKEVYVIKVAAGSTQIGVEWADGGAQRISLINYIQQAKIELAGKDVRYRFYWSEWENTANANPTDSANFEALYEDLIAAVEVETGALYSQAMLKVNPNAIVWTNQTVNSQAILDAQNTLDLDSNFQLIDADDLSLFDGIHYASLGQIEIGNRVTI